MKLLRVLLGLGMALLFLLVTLKGQAVLPPPTGQAPAYYVATTGNDNGPGTLAQPWRTIQKAADTAGAGSTVYVRGGSYPEQVTIHVSGSAAGGFVTFRNYEGETPILDGTAISLNESNSAAIRIEDQSYVVVQGFEIRNYRSASRSVAPVAIFVQGSAHHIQLKDNRIHAIETTALVDAERQGADAHAIAVYGTNVPESIHEIVIANNELYDLKLGSSEALVLNGNVEGFTIVNNYVHDADNIGIDLIGFEGIAPDPAYDQARKGTVIGNRVERISSFGNPSYGNVYSAGGIYVDGGRDIVIEQNMVSLSDIGIELASEHAGRATSRITVRSNVLHHNRMAGLLMGGYDTARGSTVDC
ncbi:MAG: right-handed parallel beta-helix repeat-containing protein, partial [Ardenticatenales bacterium]|nr:right-handed parallel beta-helix repeat-containing protein [Ardenticatenales bacterium]